MTRTTNQAMPPVSASSPRHPMLISMVNNGRPPSSCSSELGFWTAMNFNFFLFSAFSFVLISAGFNHAANVASSSIVFSTIGRSNYSFDIFSLPALGNPSTSEEIQITDGESVNYNGHFASSSSISALLSSFDNQNRLPSGPTSLQLVSVTERNGSSNIFLDAVSLGNHKGGTKRSGFVTASRFQVPLLSENGGLKDRPTISGDYLVYVSTHENAAKPRKSWAAVYSTNLKLRLTRRLTPYGVADFSPSVSPSGLLTAVASYGESGWNGEVEDLTTDIYVFLTRDGAQRVKVVEHGGWPCWADESTLYFHRRGSDQWWSIYRATLPKQGLISTESVVIKRVTPPGLHAFTPATSQQNKNFIVVATRRSTSDYRHIELFDIVTGEFKELTRLVSPQTHHYNPFISPDSTLIGYHKCRGGRIGRKSFKILLENIQSPVPGVSLFRIDGFSPSFSPTGDRIAYVNLPGAGAYVVNSDGSKRRQIFSQLVFSTAWDPVRMGVLYASAGPILVSESTDVDVISINVDDDDELSFKKLTTGGKNNAFPSPSPDGNWIVFRSGRTGHKNLYIMDAVEGESRQLHRLTDGPWTDTMCNWSPDGDYIAFASDRDNPGSGSFELYLIHPNKTGLRKLIQSGSNGKANHPWFSPDSKTVVFTTDYAAISAEPISNPNHFQPHGEIFTVKLDGSGLRRLTHNAYEDGTPTWVPHHLKEVDVERLKDEPLCQFDDCLWLKAPV